MKLSNRESDLVAGALQLLNAYPSVYAWRSNNAGVKRTDKKGRSFWTFSGVKGCADILGLIGPYGTLLVVEVKKPGGKPPSLHQLAFLAQVEKRGGLAWVVDDLRELQKKIELELDQRLNQRDEWPGT